MRTLLRMLIGFTISALLPSTALAQKTTYDYDRGQDFGRLKTYAFAAATKSDNPLVDERIASAIDAQLAARGMTKDNARPDVYVSTRQTFETHKEYTTYGNAYGPYGWGWGGYGWGWGGYYGYSPSGYTEVQETNVTVGTLTIDLTDPETERLVWRGVGTRTEHPHAKPERVTRRINHQVEEIFEHFPPGQR